MADKENVSRRHFLLGRLRRAPRPSGDPIPGPGSLRGTQRTLPAELLALGTQEAPVHQPVIYDIVLPQADVDALLREVARSATDLMVLLKGAPQQAAREGVADLRGVRGALHRGEIVQLRYRHEGVLWSDTLRPGRDTTALTRCELPPQFGA